MADRTDKTLGDYRRCGTFYRSMDELYDSEVTITIQRYYRKTGDQRNPSGTVHDPRNDQVSSQRWGSDYP
ncbi:hypothetical protein Tco_0196295 [Tanacetum coccineum]